jgi:hypothetical protein
VFVISTNLRLGQSVSLSELDCAEAIGINAESSTTTEQLAALGSQAIAECIDIEAPETQLLAARERLIPSRRRMQGRRRYRPLLELISPEQLSEMNHEDRINKERAQRRWNEMKKARGITQEDEVDEWYPMFIHDIYTN